MANVKKSARVLDQDIIRLNYSGLSLKAIADRLGCHAATITLRLKALGVAPSDTRRSFMEQIFAGLDFQEQEWLSNHLFNNEIPVRVFITDLIKRAYLETPATVIEPPRMPAMLSGEETPAESATAEEVLATAADPAVQAEIPMVPSELVEEEEPAVNEEPVERGPLTGLFSRFLRG